MGKPALTSALMALAMGHASATEINIACTVTQATTFIGSSMFVDRPDGPWNFTITDEGLRTSLPAPCDLMKGSVSAANVSVACVDETFSYAVKIDRQLGTFNLTLKPPVPDPANTHLTSKVGTCQKREAF